MEVPLEALSRYVSLLFIFVPDVGVLEQSSSAPISQPVVKIAETGNCLAQKGKKKRKERKRGRSGLVFLITFVLSLDKGTEVLMHE